ncbi:hypothetical protein Agabi119p4_8070 [Agaricus bisporus var. burnettii]|uniref:RRM domain-containing protein n=1 Tax=Agaricus bisporus var. burnettii TaxID=192524 RepID=A0A8H7C547_AGABI|nr:hypothetical protein Agabi119p4_8070 [Agaricus bisporus var. burnettii]
MDPVRTQSLLSRPASAHPKSPSPPPQPSNDDIEAVIQMATASRQNPDGRSGPPKDTRTQLFVGNLPYRVRWQDLKDLFRRAGTVLRADVSLGPDNRSRGYGTVLLATAEDAGRAIDMFHGYSWQTRILEVRPDRLPPDFDNPLPAPAPKPALPTLAFSPPPSNTLSTSFPSGAHITSPSRAARNLSDDFDYNPIFGSEVLNASSSSCRNLFVGNLPFHCQWQDLKDLFRQAGTIMRADVALGPDGRSRGFGTVVFATEQDAERAVKMFNGYEYNGRVLKVHFDRYSHLSQPPASPSSPTFQQAMSSATMNQPSFTATMAWTGHLNLPLGYQSEFLPPSRPSSPYDLYHTDTSLYTQRSKSPLRQNHSRPQPQPQDIPPTRLSREGDSESKSSNMDTIPTQLASVKLGPVLPPSNPSLVNTKSRILDGTSSDVAQNTDTALGPPQPQSQQQKSEMRPTAGNSSQNQHPHHPGPISLPPPGLSFPVSPNTLSPLHHPGIHVQMSPIHHPSMGSPLHHPAYPSHQQLLAITPLGLPAITPSMPPFIFHPMPPGSPTASVHASPVHMPMYAGPASFSPTVAMSPGAFWGRPGNHHPNPLINPAVGAPVHVHSPSAMRQMGGNPNLGGSAYFYPPPGPSQVEPSGYFDPAYFPPGAQHPTTLGHSGLVNEILNEEAESVSEHQGTANRSEETLAHPGDKDAGKERDDDSPSTDRSTNDDDDDEDNLGRSNSQDSTSGTNTTCTTSWYNSEESCDEKGDLENQGSEAIGSGRDSATSRAASSTSNCGNVSDGNFHAEKKVVSRARSLSGDAKPAFSGAYKLGSGSELPMKASPGEIESTVAARSPSAQQARSLRL